MDHFHTRTHNLKGTISPHIQQNIKYTTKVMQDCNDLVQKQFKIGIDHKISIYIVYMDGLVNTEMLQESVIRPLLQDSFPQERTAISQYVIESADWKWIDTMEDAMTAVLSGNTVLFLDGEARAILFSSKSFPTRGVQNADQEVAIVGPKDSFTESLRMNTALIRRRIRDTRLKVIQKQIGTRSKTDYALMYIEDLVQKDILNKIQKQMDKICVDGIFDNGMLQQYLEKDSKTPFPLYQLTQRPDKVASSIMEGRIAVVLDNSPMVLLLPVTFNVFFQASDDYYNRWEITTFVRILRYVAAIISIGLPGFYVAIAGFHPEVLPTPFLLALISAREGVPFPVIVEVLLMELSFELLREAGIRLPGQLGGTMGVVGGLIVGQAAAMFLPQIALQKSYHSGIVVVVMASVMAGIYLWIVDHAARGVSIENVLKRYRFAAIIYYVRFLLNGAFFYLCILYLTKKYLLPDKSTFFIGLPLLLLAYLMNQGGLTKRGRVMEGIFWFVLLPLIFVLILSMANLSWDELAVRSWCGREMLNGSILVFALMHPIEFVWFYRGDMRDGPIRMRLFAGLMILFLGVFASTVGSLGKKLTMVDPEPVMSMAQGVAMPGGIMARLDLFLIAFWIVGVFCVFSGYLFYGNESIKHAFSKGRIVGLSLSYGGIYVISPWIMTTFATWIRRYFFVFIYGNLVIGLFFPLILFLMWRKEQKDEKI